MPWLDDDPATLAAKAEFEKAEREQRRTAEPPPPEPLCVVNPAKWQGRFAPKRSWIVPDWIPIGVATGLYGPPGHGKTLIVQQLLTATALAQPWLGRSATRVKSLAFLCEDDEEELWRRQQAINRFYGCEHSDIGDFVRLVPRLGHDNILMSFKDGRRVCTPFYDQVLNEALDFGAQLVIVDTVADTFGGNQNDMGHARQFVQGLAAIALKINGGIVACAHPSQSGKTSGSGESGSVQWDAAFRSRAYLDTPKPENGEAPDADARILSRVKANYARRDATIPLRWQDGVFVATDAPTGIIGSIQRRTAERVFRDMLDRITSEGQRVSHNSRAGNYAPKIFSLRPDREGFHKADFERAMHTLLSRKEIAVTIYKDGSRKEHECLEACAA